MNINYALRRKDGPGPFSGAIIVWPDGGAYCPVYGPAQLQEMLDADKAAYPNMKVAQVEKIFPYSEVLKS